MNKLQRYDVLKLLKEWEGELLQEYDEGIDARSSDEIVDEIEKILGSTL